MGNPWMDHVADVRKANAGKSLKEILKMAKKTYKKSPAAHKKAHKKSHKKSHKKTHKKSHNTVVTKLMQSRSENFSSMKKS